MTCYYLAGIHIQTELELPLPVPACPVREAEVSLFEGPPLAPDEAPTEIGWDWSIPSRATVSYPGLGIASIVEGRQILLRPCGTGPEWRGLLLPVFAALMYQRGILCLHGSAVCHDGVSIGFLGECGAGKSTIVAQLTCASWRFLADDLLFVNSDSFGLVRAHPGFSILKLWEDSAQAAGHHFSRMGRLYPDAQKDGFTPGKQISEMKPQALRALFLLEEGDEIKIERIPPAEALLELAENTYGAQVFEGKPAAQHFQQCGLIAARVPLYRLIRPKDFSRANEIRERIENFDFSGRSEGFSPSPA